MNRREFVLSSLSVSALSGVAPTLALAQAATSSQPLRIIVATPPGGASDAAARALSQVLSKNLGQQVVVENKPGGNGVPAVQTVLAAPADGRTLLWTMSSMAGMPMLVKGAPIKSLSEMLPITSVVNLVYGVFVNPLVPAKTMAELTEHLRANPGKLSYGTGVLSEYMVALHYLHAIGAKAVRVPYKGGAQLMPDLISGVLQFNIGPLAPALAHVKTGKLRLLATLPDRAELIAGVPSMHQSGINTDQIATWNGLTAPPGTPKEAIDRLAHEVHRALAEPSLRSQLEAQGFRIADSGPAQFGAAIESAAVAWRQFIRDYDIPQE